MKRESARVEALLDAMTSTIALLDGHGIVMFVNAAWRNFAVANGAGLHVSWVGQDYLAVCASANGVDAAQIHAIGDGIRAVLGGTEVRFSAEYACHSPAEPRWFEMTVTPVGSRGEGALITHVDITQRRRAEEANARALVRLNEAQRVACIGDWDFSVAEQAITWSPQVYEILGRDPDLGPPRNEEEHAAYYTPESRKVLAEAIARAISSGLPQEYDLVARLSDGEEIDVHAVAVPVPDENGIPTRLHGTVQDITARKRSARAFTELAERTERRERMLSVLLSSMNDFAYIFDRDGRFLFASQRLLDLLQVPLEGIIGKNFLELGYPLDLATRLQEQIEEVFVTHGVVRDETRFVGPDGRDGYYEYVFSPVLAPDESAEFVVGSTRDVTERNRVERELRDRDEKFHQLADHIHDVFWIRSADMTELHYLSPAFERIWGRSPSVLMTNPLAWGSFIQDDDRERVEEAFRSLRTGAQSIDEEYRIFRPDGETRWVRSRGFRVTDEEGVHIRNIGIVTDTTDRRLAEDALRQSQKRLRDIFNGLGPSLFVGLLTTEGVVVEMNRSALDAAGLTSDEVVGKPFDETYWWSHSADARQMLRDAIRRTADGEPSRYDVQTRGVGDSRIDIDFSLHPLHDESGNVTFLISSGNVITERKVAEETLRQAQKMEAVGQLAAGVAHEFNNMMQALMAMSAMMRLRDASEESASIGAEIESLAKRGAGLTQQLLLFSRHRSIERSTLDLGVEVSKANTLLQQLMPGTIRIVVDVPDARLHVQGDSGQMQQVLLNFAINARDAMPGGGTLTLRAGRAAEHTLFLEVEDTGCGMSAETRLHLFEPFFTTKGPAKGTGLGLAVAHGIVQQHSGSIDVHTSPGEGSRFRVLLPESIVELAPVAASTSDEHERGDAKRLLLLEDDPQVREGLAVLLEWAGYDVVMASSGEEALALAIDPPPELLLSDVTLPGISGPATAKRLRERWPELRVVLMSGYADDEIRAIASEEAWRFVQKPFDFADLEQVLRNAILELVA